MRIERHPLGVWCREDGAVYLPQSGTHKAHWTYGTCVKDGYRRVMVARKLRLVHRLVAEAFHGPCPPDKSEVDHINRVKDDNRPSNLHWVSRSENMYNTGVHAASVARYGVASASDLRGYQRAYSRVRLAGNPELRERQNASNRRYYAAHQDEMRVSHRAYYAAQKAERKAYSAAYRAAQKAKGLVFRKCQDGKRHWIAKTIKEVA